MFEDPSLAHTTDFKPKGRCKPRPDRPLKIEEKFKISKEENNNNSSVVGDNSSSNISDSNNNDTNNNNNNNNNHERNKPKNKKNDNIIAKTPRVKSPSKASGIVCAVCNRRKNSSGGVKIISCDQCGKYYHPRCTLPVVEDKGKHIK